ncbi:MAG: fliJ [Phenylobacterium sp.]|uniref:flagellar export protein FliJ n=1 Tax=Phenylobacterium sp. TaxID=1871053 RepID=UPI0026044356|nr:flagellar export protein FliJ [Phenylobacterium sp.]MDB5497759.1 fliJ [Phenylobacterium sp.]
MSWSESLIKLATYEVESRQQQLAEIARRLAHAEMRLALLQAEGEAEATRATQDAQAGWYHAGYAEGLRIRKAALKAEIDVILAEERGARDGLAQAFEEQKKYEQVAESMRLAALKEANRRENAEFDEVGMRAARRR